MADNVPPFFFCSSYGGGGGSNPPNGVKTKCKKKSSPPELPLPNPNDTSSLIFVSIASHRYMLLLAFGD